MKNLLALTFAVGLVLPCFGQKAVVRIAVDSSLHQQPLSGRLYLSTQKDTIRPVNSDPDPFGYEPVFAKNVTQWQQGEAQVIDAGSEGIPHAFDQLKPGCYKVAAVLDQNTETRQFAHGPGNLYSDEAILCIPETGTAAIVLTLTHRVQPRQFNENDSVKGVAFKSRLLSDFHKKTVSIEAAVILPTSYRTQPEKRYPIVYVIPGWGGTHYDVLRGKFVRTRYGMGLTTEEKIYVYLNPETQTPYGLHAFVDSDLNGPWGKALVEELIPWIDQQYRTEAKPATRFVMGQSSGGYGALWLQLFYPEAFGGCWAVSPDPVDFRHFTGVNLYEKGVNLYVDAAGKERGILFMKGQALSTLRQMVAFEDFFVDGGQMLSFEAEFGKADKNGRPQPLFDRKTGALRPAVVKAWQRYDLAHQLPKIWKKSGSLLAGKVHVYAGSEDNFLLQHAVTGFGEQAKAINATLVAEIIPGADHFSVWSPVFTKRVQAEMDQLVQAARQ